MANAFRLHPQLAADSLLITQLTLCEVRLINDSRFPWCLLVPRLLGNLQWHQLRPKQAEQLQVETRRVASAVDALIEVERLNFGSLGNLVPQLHIHVVGRRSGDAAWPGPVWGFGAAERYTPSAAQALCETLRNALTD